MRRRISMRTSRSLMLILGLLTFSYPVLSQDKTAQEESSPLFAVAAEGSDSTAEISRLAGIAPYFHLYSENGVAVEVVPNEFLDLEFGTGPAAAQMLVDKGVAVLVAKRIPGPKMMEVLENNEVRLVRRIGKVQDVADELKE
jgi:predicted Fe-Mo cluster-binding NifX family protein